VPAEEARVTVGVARLGSGRRCGGTRRNLTAATRPDWPRPRYPARDGLPYPAAVRGEGSHLQSVTILQAAEANSQVAEANEVRSRSALNRRCFSLDETQPLGYKSGLEGS
jgi:hypothetical protein